MKTGNDESTDAHKLIPVPNIMLRELPCHRCAIKNSIDIKNNVDAAHGDKTRFLFLSSRETPTDPLVAFLSAVCFFGVVAPAHRKGRERYTRALAMVGTEVETLTAGRGAVQVVLVPPPPPPPPPQLQRLYLCSRTYWNACHPR